MAANKKKFIAKAAFLGAAAAVAKFIIHKSKSFQTKSDTDSAPEDEDNYLDAADFASIGNDTDRQYVSIRINEHTSEK